MYSLTAYSPIQTNSLFIHSFATAYYEAGELEKEKAEYERIVDLKTERDDLYARSFYKLGLIHENQGNKDKAIEHYEKFLSLWKDADPGLPEVDNAKMRLAELKNP